MNVSVNEAVWPAASVKGNFSPLTPNSELVKLFDETVTGAPFADSVPGRLLLEPTTTVPKFIVAGDTANWPAVVPSPDIFTINFEFEALELTEMLPLALSRVFGVKVTLKVTL